MGFKINDGRIKPKKAGTFGAKKPFKGKNKNRKGSLKNSFPDEPAKRLNPKPSMKNIKLLTLDDREYLRWLQTSSYDCFACGKSNGIEWHHVKEFSSDKKDHKRLIPLCGVECHRLGTELSAHGTPKKFRGKFSMELQNGFADKIYENYEKEMS